MLEYHDAMLHAYKIRSFQRVLLSVWNTVSVGRLYEDWFRFWVSKHSASQVRHSFITSVTLIALVFSHPPPPLYGAVKPRRLSLPTTRSAPSLWQRGSCHKHISQLVTSAQMVTNSSNVMETVIKSYVSRVGVMDYDHLIQLPENKSMIRPNNI